MQGTSLHAKVVVEIVAVSVVITHTRAVVGVDSSLSQNRSAGHGMMGIRGHGDERRTTTFGRHTCFFVLYSTTHMRNKRRARRSRRGSEVG